MSVIGWKTRKQFVNSEGQFSVDHIRLLQTVLNVNEFVCKKFRQQSLFRFSLFIITELLSPSFR